MKDEGNRRQFEKHKTQIVHTNISPKYPNTPRERNRALPYFLILFRVETLKQEFSKQFIDVTLIGTGPVSQKYGNAVISEIEYKTKTVGR